MPTCLKAVLAALFAFAVTACTSTPPPEADLTPPPRSQVKDSKFDLESGKRRR